MTTTSPTPRKSRQSSRTDPHRPGAIVPGDYRPVLWYSLASVCEGVPVPAYRVDCVLDLRRVERGPNGETIRVIDGEHAEGGRCCLYGLSHILHLPFSEHGGIGRCSVCKANYIEGEVWEHVPTGEHIHVGHTCSDKYEMLADWSADELARDRLRASAARDLVREKNAQERTDFLAAHPGLAEDLAVDHDIVRDIAARFARFGEVSDKQVALVHKLAAEVRNPPPEEVKVETPTGRVTFRGRVVSVKAYEGDWGVSMKMTVKVTTPGGVWLAWGTAPSALLDATCNHTGALCRRCGGYAHEPRPWWCQHLDGHSSSPPT